MRNKGFVRAEDKAKIATFTDDIFNWSCYTKPLTKLVKNTTNPYVIALSAEWGNGKTFFLNAWRNSILPEAQKEQQNNNPVKKDITNNCSEKFLLKENEIPCVYIDAWALEDLDDPLLAVCYEIQEQLKVYFADIEDNLLETAIEFASVKNLLKIGASFVQDKADSYKKTAETISEIFSSSVEKVQKIENSSSKILNSINKVINNVKRYTETNSILIMIDELDRCNPKYIVKLLERIKNLFNISGLVFVLAVDNQILRFAIMNEFGFAERELQDKYLDKFIDYFYNLPKPDYEQYICTLIEKAFDPTNVFSLGNYKNLSIEIEQEILKVNEQDIFNVYNKYIISNRPGNSGTFEYIEKNFYKWCFLQQCLCYIALKGILKTDAYTQQKKHSLRSIEKLFAKFITVYKSNEFNFIECLFLMKYCIRNHFQKPSLERRDIKNLCLFELICSYLLDTNIANNELEEFRANLKTIHFEDKRLNEDDICRFDALVDYFKVQLTENIEEKIIKAVDFYNLTQENESDKIREAEDLIFYSK